MIVYVESNFVLEIALEQRDASSAEAILRLAENGEIELVIPAVALAEPFSKLGYRNVERRAVGDAWTSALNRPKPNELTDLGLAGAHRSLLAALNDVTNAAADLVAREASRLEDVVRRILRAARLLDTKGTEFEQGFAYRSQYELSYADSVIYATIISDLRNGTTANPSCFASRDTDFAQTDISTELASFNSRYISTFHNALDYIRSQLPTP